MSQTPNSDTAHVPTRLQNQPVFSNNENVIHRNIELAMLNNEIIVCHCDDQSGVIIYYWPLLSILSNDLQHRSQRVRFSTGTGSPTPSLQARTASPAISLQGQSPVHHAQALTPSADPPTGHPAHLFAPLAQPPQPAAAASTARAPAVATTLATLIDPSTGRQYDVANHVRQFFVDYNARLVSHADTVGLTGPDGTTPDPSRIQSKPRAKLFKQHVQERSTTSRVGRNSTERKKILKLGVDVYIHDVGRDDITHHHRFKNTCYDIIDRTVGVNRNYQN